MNKQVGKTLLTKYLNGSATEQEKLLVEEWYAGLSLDKMSEETTEDYQRIKSEMWSSIPLPAKPKRIYRRLWVRVAAAVLLVSTFAVVYYSSDYFGQESSPAFSERDTTVIKPGGVGATLTLSDGQQIKLMETLEGELAQEAGISITKADDGSLIYEVKGSAASSETEKTNILTTAKGETYMIVLPDKSKVWLNASSRLEFSTRTRKVKLEGEGYFEIAKDKTPFIVETRNQQVEVLGTHFNINAYREEDHVKTTLLEGKVRVITDQATRELSPGQQVVNTAGKLAVQEVDLEAMVAWKNGYFKFDCSLETVMRTIARWYDLDLDFAPKCTQRNYIMGLCFPIQRARNDLATTGANQ